MRHMSLVLAAAALLPLAAAAQDQQTAGASGAPALQAPAMIPPPAKPEGRGGITVRTRANVRVDLTISDQTGSGPIEKKTVTLIAAEESWGKIRTAAHTKSTDMAAGPVTAVRLNVDARPFLTTGGQIQLELTIDYNPLGAVAKDAAQLRPTEINQSMTVVLTSGKPVIISQAADPITDRKVTVEVTATVLK